MPILRAVNRPWAQPGGWAELCRRSALLDETALVRTTCVGAWIVLNDFGYGYRCPSCPTSYQMSRSSEPTGDLERRQGAYINAETIEKGRLAMSQSGTHRPKSRFSGGEAGIHVPQSVLPDPNKKRSCLMTEERLRVESWPPEHMLDDSAQDAPPADRQESTADGTEQQAQEVAGQAKQQAQQVAGQAKQQAQVVAGQAKDKAVAQVDERTTQAGQQLGAQGESLQGVAGELRSQGNEAQAKVAEQAAERVKQVGDYLEQTDGESLVQAAADAARENPAAAAAAGAAAGLVAGRVIKASREAGPAEEQLDRPDEGAA